MQRGVSNRDQVFELARTYFSNPNVVGLSYDDKVKELNIMISSKLVIISGISRNELVDWFNQNVGRSGFEGLGKDPLSILLNNSDPKTVLTLCKTHPQISRLCRDDQVFENLLRIHFPDDFDIDDIPYKDQYKFLTGGGKVWAFGNNEAGQLGPGDNFNRNTPKMIPSLPVRIKQVSSGSSHTVLLDTEGRVWTFGNGVFGRLGLEDNLDRNIPAMIPNLPVRIKQVSSGSSHTIILDMDDRVWTFGNGVRGQLGLGDDVNRYTPVMIPNLPVKIKQISSGGRHTVLLDTEGRVWTFGRGGLGILGLGDNFNKNTPVMIPNLAVRIKQISAGENHTVLLDTEGRVWSFGNGLYGRLGLGDNDNKNTPEMIPNLPVRIKQVSSGDSHTVLLDTDGRVWTFGYGVFGQLGLGDNISRLYPAMIPNLVKIKQVSAGSIHTVLLDTVGRVWTVGRGVSGRLGLGDVSNKNTLEMIPNLPVKIKQVSAGGSHTVLLVFDL